MSWNCENIGNESILKIDNYEEKMIVAKKVASYIKDGDVIGFGSGSTSLLAVCEIAKRLKEEKINITAIPTSNEIRMKCIDLNIPITTLNDVKPDWGFDGADEVDTNLWLTKGRGGAMFKEKLVMSNCPKTYILVDSSKFVNHLCEKASIPVECDKEAYKSVTASLYNLGAKKVKLRLDSNKDAVITENGNYILDCIFDNVSSNLEKDIKKIVGVLESGLFINYNIEIISTQS